MTIHSKMFALFWITVVSLFLLIIISCGTTYYSYNEVVVQEPTIGLWEKYHKQTNRGIFEGSNLSIEAIGLQTARISGVVKLFRSQETRERRWIGPKKYIRNQYASNRYYPDAMHHRAPGSTPTGQSSERTIPGNYEIRPGVQYTKGAPIKDFSLSITNPFGLNKITEVNSNGNFSQTIQIDKKHCFFPPSREKLSKYFNIDSQQISFSIQPNNITGEGLTDCPRCISFIEHKVYSISVNQHMVRSYTEALKSLVILEVRDKITRLPISAIITVTGSDVPSPNAIKQKLTSEFGDRSIAEDAMRAWLDSYLTNGEKKHFTGQSIEFKAIVGATYRIETIHGGYYYFKGFLKIPNKSVVNKTILLIEKGSKIRVEEVKEGEGGVIVDP